LKFPHPLPAAERSSFSVIECSLRGRARKLPTVFVSLVDGHLVLSIRRSRSLHFSIFLPFFCLFLYTLFTFLSSFFSICSFIFSFFFSFFPSVTLSSLSLFTFFHLFLYLSLSLYLRIIYFSIRFFISLSICVFVSLSLSFFLSLSLFLSLFISLSFSLLNTQPPQQSLFFLFFILCVFPRRPIEVRSACQEYEFLNWQHRSRRGLTEDSWHSRM
jgi:hypothetical protein